jgi:nitrite reductase/ring-hydroxylating ferredoxin subunit
MPESELGEGEMKRIDVDGGRVLVAKRDERIYAIAEVCSHLGGPLAEGKFEGCTVQCPWHGSRFSIEDGSVIDGPATYAQPALDVRVRDGQIEVRSTKG